MKKYKKLTFSFSILSLLGSVLGFFEASAYMNFDWTHWFGFIIVFSMPLIVLWIYTKVFNDD
jgi:hypothetical protein